MKDQNDILDELMTVVAEITRLEDKELSLLEKLTANKTETPKPIRIKTPHKNGRKGRWSWYARKKKSEAMKLKWASYSPEQKAEIIKRRHHGNT